jgi:uncharacterized membrane protein
MRPVRGEGYLHGIRREGVMTTLTPFNLTPLGLFHTLVSLLTVAAAFVALFRDKGISTRTAIGRVYLVSLLVTTVTGFPIFRNGSAGPPHVVGVLTLIALAVGAAGTFRRLGRASEYVAVASYSTTVLLLMIPTVTETLTRVPPGAPLVASPEAPIFLPLYSMLLVLYMAGVVLQLRALRGSARAQVAAYGVPARAEAS